MPFIYRSVVRPSLISKLHGISLANRRIGGEFWKITGDPTEAALMIAADKLDFNPANIKSEVSLPFESENQLMAVNCWYKNKKYVLVMGAPEMSCKRSKHLLLKDSTFTPGNLCL